MTRLRFKTTLLLAVSTIMFGRPVYADDACAPGAIHSLADVQVSDGLIYQVEGLYKSRDRAASRFIRDNGSIHVVEGPNVWVSAGGEAELAGDFQRDYALGHQFHAFLLRFDEVVGDIERVDAIEFAGKIVSGTRGTRDTGGMVYLIDGSDKDRPAGLRYDVADLKIEITADDWRTVDEKPVPFALTIDDGERIFVYRYQWVDLGAKPLTWFYDKIAEPDLAAVGIERLHRKLLIAHCLGNADMMAELTAPFAVVANSGSVFETSPEGITSTFTNVFSRRKYSAYIDTQHPRVTAADSADIGWAAVQVTTRGITPADNASFEEHWAWVMMAKKIEGEWRMAGNASNLRPE